jgi:virginiamycin B lyase
MALFSAFAMCLLATIGIGVASARADGPYAEYALPQPAMGPCEVSVDQNGIEWNENILASDIGRVDPSTGAYTQYSTPTPLSIPGGTRVGADGNLWFPEFVGNKLAELNTQTGAVTEFPIPGLAPSTPGVLPAVSDDITSGADGALYFTEIGANKIGRIDPFTDAITQYPIPTPGAVTLNIDDGPNGSILFAEYAGNKIGQFSPSTHTVTEYPLSTPGSLPYYATEGTDGAIWFDTQGTNQIGRIDPVTHAITLYDVSTLLHPLPAPGTLLSANDGNLWFNLGGSPFPGNFATSENVARFNITTHVLTVFSTPGLCDLQFGSAAPGSGSGGGASDTTMWGGEFIGNKILAFNTAAADALPPSDSTSIQLEPQP